MVLLGSGRFRSLTVAVLTAVSMRLRDGVAVVMFTPRAATRFRDRGCFLHA